MNRDIPTYLLFASLLFSVYFTAAQAQGRQNQAIVPEMVYVHADKDVYVAGESIRYKTYLINLTGDKSPCSRIVYFCLTGAGRDNMIDWRINIDSSSASGSLKIPEDIRPGMYVLTAYTNWMRNNPPNTWFSDRILITSLKSGSGDEIRSFNPQWSTRTTSGPGNIQLDLHTAGTEFVAGGEVEVEFELNSNTAINADVSVSVTALSPLDSMLADQDIEAAFNSVYDRVTGINPARCRYKIEDRGFILSGRIISAQAAQKNPCDVWLAVADSIAPRVLFAPVDSDGTFRFFLNRTYDNKELIIQLAGTSAAADCRIELFGKTAQPPDTTTHSNFLGLSEQHYLNTVKNVRLVEAVYASREQAGVIYSTGPGSAFLKMPDRVVIPAEYADLNNFREIASNILPEVKFGTRHDAFFLEVLSPNITVWKENFLVMLNGVPFTDLAYISTLGTKEIRRIEVIQPNVLIGKMTLPGLVSIYTYNGKIPENYLRSRTVRYKNTVIQATQARSGIPNNKAVTANFPDFRNSVYWEPFLKIASGKRYTVKFPAGLLTGDFVIRVNGITSNGLPVTANGYFKVKEK